MTYVIKKTPSTSSKCQSENHVHPVRYVIGWYNNIVHELKVITNNTKCVYFTDCSSI